MRAHRSRACEPQQPDRSRRARRQGKHLERAPSGSPCCGMTHLLELPLFLRELVGPQHEHDAVVHRHHLSYPRPRRLCRCAPWRHLEEMPTKTDHSTREAEQGKRSRNKGFCPLNGVCPTRRTASCTILMVTKPNRDDHLQRCVKPRVQYLEPRLPNQRSAFVHRDAYTITEL